MDELISRAAMKNMITNHWSDFSNETNYRTALACVDAVPTITPSQPEIIYCKDCIYWHSGSCEYPEHAVNCQDYMVGDMETEAEHFCGYAERRVVTK